MKTLFIRLFRNNNHIEEKEDELVFKNKFSVKEIQSNKHFKVKNSNLMLQVNSNMNHFNIHDFGRLNKDLLNYTQDEYLELIKNIAEAGNQFTIVAHDEIDDLEIADLGVKTFNPEDSVTQYMARLEEEFDTIFDVMSYLLISNDFFDLKVYSSKIFTFTAWEPIDLKDVLTKIGDITTLYSNGNLLEEVKMVEKPLVEKTNAELNVITNYMNVYKKVIPKEVLNVLDAYVTENK